MPPNRKYGQGHQDGYVEPFNGLLFMSLAGWADTLFGGIATIYYDFCAVNKGGFVRGQKQYWVR